jgi:hypothetical protein
VNSLGGEVCEGDVVVANGPQARQDLRERCDNEVLGMPAKKFKKIKLDQSPSHTVAGQPTSQRASMRKPRSCKRIGEDNILEVVICCAIQ